MSYASQKGYKGEREVAEFLTNVFKQWGFKFMRIGGTEKNKKIFAGDVVLDYRTDKEQNCVLRDYYIEVKKQGIFAGDVVLDYRTDKEQNCVLRDYYIEVKKQGKPNVFADYEKAKDDAEYWNKKGAIMFVIKSEKGKFDNKKIVVLDWQIFAQLVIKSEKGKFDNKKIVVLDWQIFAQLIKDLQYYYDPNK